MSFGANRGSGGYAPCKPIFSNFHLKETWENGACEGTQAVLAILLQSVRRKIASFRLHRQPAQNSYGRNRPFWDSC